jgi:RNA polymerase sigma-70 factor (ECF subfamily)
MDTAFAPGDVHMPAVSSAPLLDERFTQQFPADSSISRETSEHLNETFTALLAYHDRLYYVAFRILRDREDVLDALQNAYMQAYRSLHRFRGESHPYTWLYRITLNECLRRRARRTVRRQREEDLPVREERGQFLSAEDVAFHHVDRERTVRTIRQAIHRLPEIYRDVVQLRYFGHMSYQEMADVSACEIGTVRSRLARARGRLKRMLSPALLSEFV